MTLDKILLQCSQNYKIASNNIDFNKVKEDKIFIADDKKYMTLGIEYLYTINELNQVKEYYCMYNIYKVKNKKYYDPMLNFYLDNNNKVLVLTNYLNTYMNVKHKLSFNDDNGFLNISSNSFRYNILFQSWIKDLQYQQMFAKLKKIQTKQYDKQTV
jgi:hypothetical protein